MSAASRPGCYMARPFGLKLELRLDGFHFTISLTNSWLHWLRRTSAIYSCSTLLCYIQPLADHHKFRHRTTNYCAADGKLLHSGCLITACRMANYCSRMCQNFGTERLRPITQTFRGGNIINGVISEPN